VSDAGPVLVAKGLGRAWGARVVLEGVELEVRPGEVLGLIGPNGGGKSTLLLLCAGLVRPTSGEVLVDGLPAAGVAEARQGTVGLITADAGVYPLLSGRENLDFFGGLYGLDAAQIERRSRPFLEELDLLREIDRPTAEWSSGMRQKLSLARALLMSPKLLLLDEPTANLDPVASHQIHAAVRARADAGVAVVVATHDLLAAEGICDQVAVIRRTVVARERLTGERRVPEPGRLYALYREHAA
jgi:ABC-2 type transport system ATP-binding protein